MSKQAAKAGVEKIANPDAKEVNLEHISPQSLDSEWRSYFSTGVEPADYVNRIGNLTLLTLKVNHDVANKSFAEKQKIALNPSTLAMNKYFRNLTKWGNQEIEQRQIELAKIAVEVWKL